MMMAMERKKKLLCFTCLVCTPRQVRDLAKYIIIYFCNNDLASNQIIIKIIIFSFRLIIKIIVIIDLAIYIYIEFYNEIKL